jgi:hypothetical protein
MINMFGATAGYPKGYDLTIGDMPLDVRSLRQLNQ